ncbi:hypothetical protein [Sphingomonas sanxanigenens]|uniref:Uncharacterized protein n=1 Tax=Sphingomonas sanxanigenens DSM 19645 = NX02 TaxID=1123269 RepID=W0A603_9SPHN|nr:hypothetical protein [Sphingomonas sanxanigenens]AHE51907.1 hypothetical protein NX02_00705 [Sphingomonas sanxanigenens DSM 19645 = NX02]
MMIARRLRPLGWALAIGTAAVSFYLVSLRVASERGALEKVEREITGTQHDIRQLQTELKTRASMRQLERWNGDVLALSAPSAAQYLEVAQLARVDALPDGDPAQLNIPQTVRLASYEPALAAPAVVATSAAAPKPVAPPPVTATRTAEADLPPPTRVARVDDAAAAARRRQRGEMLARRLVDGSGEMGRVAMRDPARIPAVAPARR